MLFTNRIAQHVKDQPFVAATALAAALHSSWSLSTGFGGKMPEPGLTPQFVLWALPGVLLAFAFDIGLLVTATEIRNGQRTVKKYLAFGMLSLFMFYLQWLYLIAHTELIALAPGVSETWTGITIVLRDASIWIFPLMLPLSATLYTFSHTSNTDVMRATAHSETSDREATQEAPTIEAPRARATAKGKVTVECPDCDWTGKYPSDKAAQNALNAHMAHCTKIRTSANGHSQEAIPTS